MSKTDLLIVESKNKVASIQKYVPEHFLVESCIGHFRELKKKNTKDGKGLGIDVANNFEPEFVISEEKLSVVKKLKALAKNKTIWIATDPDREGEAIGWHLKELLNIPKSQEKRITFSSITKKDINDAIEKPASLDNNMADSAIARAIIDKLIGFTVSPLLHKTFNNWHLSGGRVQSVVLRLIIERETAVRDFKSTNTFHLKANFNKEIETSIEKDIVKQEVLDNLLKAIQQSDIKYIIKEINKNKTSRYPLPPYETATLQQDASNKLGFSPKTTMSLAQNLFAKGYITYMRTDSIYLSKEAMGNVEKYIKTTYSEKYSNPTRHKTKKKLTQEGHEACRPTNVNRPDIQSTDLTNAEKRLYRMVWQRTIASQMSPAELEIHTIKVCPKSEILTKAKQNHVFVGKAEKILFDGYLKVYGKTSAKDSDNEDDDDDSDNTNDNANDTTQQPSVLIKLLKDLKANSELDLSYLEALEKPTKPKNGRFTEATLVKQLEKLEIARPSTIVSMVSVPQDRGYVVKKTVQAIEKDFKYYTFKDNTLLSATKKLKVCGEKDTLHPTPVGTMINEYLQEHFENIINYGFTAEMETMLDEIASGNKVWQDVVKLIYNKYNPKILELELKIKNDKLEYKNTAVGDRPKYTRGVKLLGTHPTLNVDVILMPQTKAGPAICLYYEEPSKRAYANFSSPIDSMTLEKAIICQFYPMDLGQFEGHDVQIKKMSNVYIAYNNKSFSIENYNKRYPDNQIDMSSVDLLDAIKVIKEYSGGSGEKVLSDEITIKESPFKKGEYYIKYKNGGNIPLPKDKKKCGMDLTKDEITEIITKYMTSEKKKVKIEAQIKKQNAKFNKIEKKEKKAKRDDKKDDKKDDKEEKKVKVPRKPRNTTSKDKSKDKSKLSSDTTPTYTF